MLYTRDNLTQRERDEFNELNTVESYHKDSLAADINDRKKIGLSMWDRFLNEKCCFKCCKDKLKEQRKDNYSVHKRATKRLGHEMDIFTIVYEKRISSFVNQLVL